MLKMRLLFLICFAGVAAAGQSQLVTAQATSFNESSTAQIAFTNDGSGLVANRVYRLNSSSFQAGGPNTPSGTTFSPFDLNDWPKGTANTTSLSGSASVVNLFTDGATSADYASTLNAAAGLTTTITAPPAGYPEVFAESEAAGSDEFDFTLSQATELDVSGLITSNSLSSGSGDYEVLLGDGTNILFDTAKTGAFSLNTVLQSGTYSLAALAEAFPAFDVNKSGGYSFTGSYSTTISYDARFRAPTSTPEPFTLGLGVAGTAMVLRRKLCARRS